MNWSRARLKEMARIALHGSYWKSVLVSLILTIAGGTAGVGLRQIFSLDDLGGGSVRPSEVLRPSYWGIDTVAVILVALVVVFLIWLVQLALKIFVFGPLEVGCKNFFRQNLYRPVEFAEMKGGFTPNYWNVVKTQFLRRLFTWLWSLLFLIPGVIKHYEYLMMPYIQAENPDLRTEDVFELSRRMMNGEKMEAFILDLSFWGWQCLSIITFGIVGLFYVNPYVDLTHAALYGALKQKLEMEDAAADPYRTF